MALINVYSRSPISHQFSVIDEKGDEFIQIIKGVNCIPLEVITKDCPMVTQVEESIWKKITDKYKDHMQFFGGKTPEGKNIDAQMYTAKTDKEAKIRMHDSKPIIGDMQMATKTQGIEPNKAVA